jgi:hypothetical protein
MHYGIFLLITSIAGRLRAGGIRNVLGGDNESQVRKKTELGRGGRGESEYPSSVKVVKNT